MASDSQRRFFKRVSVIMICCTILLTASFIGVLAFLAGEIRGIETRVPWYILAGAITFVSTVVLLEAYEASGQTIILTASIVGGLAMILIPLGVEGLIYALRYPQEIFVSQMILYFLAASLIGSGIGYWGLNHWREFTSQSRQQV